jgi:Lrp/AsnC family transcriptional regulator for asnA, asnC and gidA
VETLDDIDQELIRLLQIDGRASYATMATKVGLSPAATRMRVTRLFDSGIVKGMVIVDPLKIGYSVAAVLGLNCTGNLELPAQEVERFAEIDWAVVTSGPYDLMVELACVNTDHLLERVNEFREIEGVTKVEVITIMKYLKFGIGKARATAFG